MLFFLKVIAERFIKLLISTVHFSQVQYTACTLFLTKALWPLYWVRFWLLPWMSLCNHEASVVRLSVRPSVNFYTQVATSTTNRTRSPPNLHTMVHTWSYIKDVLKVKVKVKGRVIPTLFWLHENRYFYHKHDSIAINLAHDGPEMGLHPGCAQGQGQGQRSRNTVSFLITRKSLLLPQTWLYRHQTCTRWSPYGLASRVCTRSRSKVTWYGHLWFHENCFFSQTNDWIATILAHDGPH